MAWLIESFLNENEDIKKAIENHKQEIKKKFSESLVPMESANIAVRNFPMSAEQLRKKLKLKDGGDTYIFATTLASGEHKLFICCKIG